MAAKSALCWFLLGIAWLWGAPGWSQVGPPSGEGFVLVPARSPIAALEHLEGRRICGRQESFWAFQALTGVRSATHVPVPFYEGLPSMDRGICDAVVAYSTDVGRVRQEGSRWGQNRAVRVISFP